MRLRSEGLGRTEIEAELVSVKRVGDLIIFFANATKPVKWKVRMAFQESDIRGLIIAFIKPKNMKFVIDALLFPKKKIPATVDF